jgi:hypothetical protein
MKKSEISCRWICPILKQSVKVSMIHIVKESHLKIIHSGFVWLELPVLHFTYANKSFLICFVFQTRHQLEKLLDWENSHLYNKLGLKWKLSRQRCDSTLMMEYVRLKKNLISVLTNYPTVFLNRLPKKSKKGNINSKIFW